MTRLSGKTAIVTGGGSGIGRAISERFAREGASVAVIDINGDAAHQTAEVIVARKRAAIAARVNITIERDVEEALQDIVERLGPIDILVNSAGVLAHGSAIETTVADWERCISVNATGTFLCSKAVVPLLRTEVQTSIVNIASAAALSGMPTVAAYSASKGAVLALTRSMALDLGHRGVRVNALCPGTVRTPMVDALATERGAGDLDAGLKWMASRYPLGRIGRPEEIAAAALFLASDEASFMTGAVVAVDGGLTAKA